MFHIGGFYEAAGIPWAHAKWLGGSEGCFAFIPKKNTMKTESEASRITLETAFFSNRTWVNWTQIIERHRDLDPQKRFFVQIIKRHQVERDAVKTVFYMSPALSTSVSKPDVDGVMYYPDDGLFGNF
jgi:hypothetical protein